MRRFFLTFAFAVGLLVGGSTSTAAADIIIDSFMTSQGPVTAASGTPSSFNSAGGLPAVQTIGGVRDIQTNYLAGPLFVDSLVVGAPTNVFTYSSGVLTTGNTNVVWDGTIGGPGINFTGLGGVDLTAMGTNDSFMGMIGADLPGGIFTVTVWTNAGLVSNFSMPIPPTPGAMPAPFMIPFASLVGTANLTNVGAIRVNIDGASAPALDTNFQLLKVTGPGGIPEPSSMVLLGLGLTGLVGGYYWRRKKA